MHSRTPNQEQLVNWLEKTHINYFCTLTFAFHRNFTPYSRNKVIKVVRRFRNRLSKALFGRQLYRGTFIPFIEDRSVLGDPQQIHVHLLISHPDNISRLNRLNTSFEDLLRDCWSKSDKWTQNPITLNSDHSVKYIDSYKKGFQRITDKRGAVIYSSKLVTKRNTECLDVDNLILPKETQPTQTH